MKLLVVVLGLTLIPTATFCQAPNSPPSTPAADTAEIYSAAIRAVFTRDPFKETPIQVYLVEDRTRLDSYDGPNISAARIREEWPLLPGDLLADFLAKNAARSRVEMIPSLLPAMKLYDSSRIRGQCPDERGWRSFYDQFPNSGGLVSVSAVGLNQHGTLALVYVAHAYGDDGGQGYMVLLKKRRGHWKATEKAYMWGWVG